MHTTIKCSYGIFALLVGIGEAAGAPIPKCDSPGIADQIKQRVADKGVEVLDIGKLKELSSNGSMRYCVATVSLSTGYDGPMSYSVLPGPSGKTIVHAFPMDTSGNEIR